MRFLTALFLLIFIVDPKPTLNIRTHFSTEDGLPGNQVREIIRDREGVIWAGTSNGPVSLSGNSWTVNQLLPKSGISTLFQDSKERYWFGGLGKASSFDGKEIGEHGISAEMKLDGRVVFSFYEDKEGRIWVGTTGGISIFEEDQWTPLVEGLRHPVVHDIEEDQNGVIWIATRKGGINIFDGDWNYYFPEKNCRKLLRDGANMWIGTSDGIIKYDGNEWHLFGEGQTILPMFRGQKGYIWCISDGVDIIRISANGEFIRYDDPTGGKAGEIYDLEYNPDGSIWAGTDQGVFVFD